MDTRETRIEPTNNNQVYSNKGTLLQIYFLKRVPVKPSGKFGDDTGTGSMVTSQHVKMTSRRFIKTSTLISNLDNSNPYEKSRRNSTEKILSGIRPNGQTKVSNSFAFKIFKGSVDCEKKHSISNETIFSSLKWTKMVTEQIKLKEGIF